MGKNGDEGVMERRHGVAWNGAWRTVSIMPAAHPVTRGVTRVPRTHVHQAPHRSHGIQYVGLLVAVRLNVVACIVALAQHRGEEYQGKGGCDQHSRSHSF